MSELRTITPIFSFSWNFKTLGKVTSLLEIGCNAPPSVAWRPGFDATGQAAR
jgi:hypothetical protein